MTEQTRLITLPVELLEQLYALATGQVEHVYGSNCPDVVGGATPRARGCPACSALKKVDDPVRASGVKIPLYVPARRARAQAESPQHHLEL